MTITYGSTVLISGGSSGVLALRINGQELVDIAHFFRAAAITAFARANKSTNFEFEAWWNFNTRGLAEAFVISHWASLANSGTLTIVCGDGEVSPVTYTMAAVLESVSLSEWKGISVKMRYAFVGGIFIQS